MRGTKKSFCLLLLSVLAFSACSNELVKDHKWFRNAAQLSGSLYLEGKFVAEGEVLIRVFATRNISELNLT